MEKKYIFLVEDNLDDELLTRRALKKNNILNDIVVARDGAEALEFLYGGGMDEIGCAPQIILLDLNLPKVNGLQILRRVRQEKTTRLLPVIILTTSDEDRDRIESYKLGANSYIRKPVDFDQFCHAILQLGIYWLVLNQGPDAEMDENG